MPSKPTISVQRTSNRVAMMKSLRKIGKKAAYVGITQATSKDRRTIGGDSVTNAELLYIHSKGSPIRGIPARPVIEPAVSASGNKEIIAREISLAMKATLDGDEAAALFHFKRAGFAGENAAKKWFTDGRNGWAPNAPATALRKIQKIRDKKLRGAAMFAWASGEDLTDYVTPLIDTGKMRNAITHVVGDDK